MIVESNADFVCLQEVIGPLFKAVTNDATIRNRYYISGNKMKGYGILLLSKMPAKFYEHKFGNSSMGRSLLIAEAFYMKDGIPQSFYVATSHLESLDGNAKTRNEQMK